MSHGLEPNAVEKFLEGADEELDAREEALPLIAQTAIDQSGKKTTVELHIHGVDVRTFDAVEEKFPGADIKLRTHGGDVWKNVTLKPDTFVEGHDGQIQITFFLDNGK